MLKLRVEVGPRKEAVCTVWTITISTCVETRSEALEGFTIVGNT